MREWLSTASSMSSVVSFTFMSIDSTLQSFASVLARGLTLMTALSAYDRLHQSDCTRLSLSLIASGLSMLPTSSALDLYGTVSEFNVSTGLTTMRDGPDFIQLANGNIVVQWEGENATTLGSDSFHLVLDESGGLLAGTSSVAENRTFDQVFLHSVPLSNAGFASSWQVVQDQYTSPIRLQINLRVFDSLGSASAPELSLAQTTQSPYQQIVALNNNEFAFVYSASTDIYVQRYNATGSSGSAQKLNLFTTDTQNNPSIAQLGTDKVITTWQSDGQSGGKFRIYAAITNFQFSDLSTDLLLQDLGSNDALRPALTTLLGNHVMLTWTPKVSTVELPQNYQLYDSDGVAVGNSFNSNNIGSEEYSFFDDPNGNGYWRVYYNSTSESVDVMVQAFSNTAVAINETITLFSYPAGSQPGQIKILRDNNLMLAWAEQYNSEWYLRGRIVRTSPTTTTTPSTTPVYSSETTTLEGMFTTANNDDGGSDSTGAIVGGVIGGLCVMTVAGIGAIVWLHSRNRREELRTPPIPLLSVPSGYQRPRIGQYEIYERISRTDARELENQTGMVFTYNREGKCYEAVIGKGFFGAFKLVRRDISFYGAKAIEGVDKIKCSSREVELLKSLKGISNVVHVEDDIQSTNLDNNEPVLWIVFKLAGLGDGELLAKRLDNIRDINLKQAICFSILQQMLMGINNIHSKNIYHLDIKPSNFVVKQTLLHSNDKRKSQMGKDWRLLYTDFGCAFKAAKDVSVPTSSIGDYHYFSPERKNPTPGVTQLSGVAIDIWALGVCALEIFTNQIPLVKATSREMDADFFKRAVEGWNETYKDQFPILWKVLFKMLDLDPDVRIKPKDALDELNGLEDRFKILTPTQRFSLFKPHQASATQSDSANLNVPYANIPMAEPGADGSANIKINQTVRQNEEAAFYQPSSGASSQQQPQYETLSGRFYQWSP